MAKDNQDKEMQSDGWRSAFMAAGLLAFLLAVSNAATYWALSSRISTLEGLRRYDGIVENPNAEPKREFEVINSHEHLYKISHLPKYLKAAEATGIARTIFVASSSLTFMGSKEGRKDEMTDWSTREILKASKTYPGKIIPFATLYTGDPKKMENLKKYVELGVQGLKLYSGHSNFYDRPLDDPEMMEVYAYCEEIGLPIIWHIRLDRFADEFRTVLNAFPGLKVVVPHFGVAFYRPTSSIWARLEQLLDTFPNLSIDMSFGTRSILVHGLEIVSANHDLFRQFFEKYADRIVFGTDMVVTGNREKTEPWVEAVIRACRDVLEKDRYHFFMAAKGSPYALTRANNIYGELRGLNLPDEILEKIYVTNIEKILQRPSMFQADSL